MWLLQSTTSDQYYSFLVGVEYAVGRKGCPILITSDQSISRRHAVFIVSHPEVNLTHPERHPTISLKDSSKYGTIINKKKMEANTSAVLKHGDEILFGSLGTNRWRIEYHPLVCAGSALSSADKKSLKASLLRLGGHYASDWSKECTHLVMAAINVTVKVICALVSCCPIITMEYVNKLNEAAESHTNLPDSSNFMPGVVEVAIRKDEVSFQPNELRKTVFRDKTFVFLTEKKYKSLSTALTFGGGKCILMPEHSKDVEMLTRPGTCVVHSSPDEDTQAGVPMNQQWASKVNTILKECGLRPIQDSEIGLAVLYCSTQLHCNPTVSQSGLNLLQAPVPQSLDTQDILAHETQTPLQACKRLPRTKGFGERSIIDETRLEKTENKKRIRENDENYQSTSKMPKFDSKEHGSNGSQGIRARETFKPRIETSPEATYTIDTCKRKDVGNTNKSDKQATLESFLQPPKSDSEIKIVSEVETDIPHEEATSILPGETEVEMKLDEQVTTKSTAHEEHEGSKPGKMQKVCSNVTPTSEKNTEEKRIQKQEVVLEMLTSDKNTEEKHARDQEVLLQAGKNTTRKTKREEADDSDDENGMWKKRVKIEPNLEVESLTTAGSAEDEQVYTRPLPGGFLSVQTQNSIKSNPDDIKPEFVDLPVSLSRTCEALLLCRQPKRQREDANDQRVVLGNVKNFKRFKKASYPGQQNMPHVIGGDDLYTHCNKMQEDVDEMFREMDEADNARNEHSQMAEYLFNNIQGKTTKSRRR